MILQPGTVLVKNFDIGETRIETRLLMRHDDGNWTGWSYRWRADQSEADLLTGSLDEEFEALDWHYPSNGECSHCHTWVSGRVLGFRTQQLNGLAYYPSTGRWANQIDTLRSLSHIERVLISDAEPEVVDSPPSDQHPAFPPPEDESISRTERLQSYLHSN